MSKEYDFLKECGYFYVLTLDNSFPTGRPFGAVMEYNNKLYISTNAQNNAHKQLRANKNITLLAKKEGTREWLRIAGNAVECKSLEIKQKNDG